MAARIIVEAGDVWDYFKENKDKFGDSIETIAENEEYGIEILLSADDDLPLIMVVADNEELDEEAAVSANDCFRTVKDMYDKYLTSEVINILIGDSEEYTAAEELEIIDERETEIDGAIYACLEELVPNMFDVVDDADDFCDDVKEHLCEYLYTKHGISIYRPMYLENEDGTDEFFEFPYPEMELDEE